MAETEGSDEASESELLDRSLSVWKGGGLIERDNFEPIVLDLHTACSLGHCEYVKALVAREEVDVDKRNKGGWTALMYACYIGHDKIVTILLDTDASVNIRNFKKESPLMLAASCGNETVGYYLVHNGAELEASDERGWTALFHATYSGHQNMVRFLLQQGANMNAVEQSVGMTPFMEAASEGHEIIVQLFLQHGVNVNAKVYNGDTARSLALFNGNMKIVSLIDNHVMPITSLRAEAGLDGDLSSSDGSFRRNRSGHVGRAGRNRGKGSGPSIRDGPEAIARLIDRTRITDPAPDTAVPTGYVTSPSNKGDGEEEEATKLSYRDVTSPISSLDYNLDSSGGRESAELEEDSNAFSKTGALTIKSSSGSSGGLAAALGIRREDSLDSDECPRESSCEDSNLHDNSESSSEEEAVEEPVSNRKGNSVQPSQDGPLLQNQSRLNNRRKSQSREDKQSFSANKALTKDKVNEIEVLQNSVKDWIDTVHSDPPPIPYDSPSGTTTPLVSDTLDHSTSIDQFSSQNCPTANTERNVDVDTPSVGLNSQTFNNPRMQQQVRKQHTSQQIELEPSSNQSIARPVSQSAGYQSEPKYQHKPYSQTHSQNRVQAHRQEYSPATVEGKQSVECGNTSSLTQSQSHVSNNSISTSGPSQHRGQQHQQQQQHHQQQQQQQHNQQKQQQQQQQQSAQANRGHPQRSLQPVGVPAGTSASQAGIPSTMIPQLSMHPEASQSFDFVRPGEELSIDTNTSSADAAEAKTPTPESGSNYKSSVNPPPGFPDQFETYQMFPSSDQHGSNNGNSSMFKPNLGDLEKKSDPKPKDLASLLEQLGLSKHLVTFEEQDVDLQVFLSLTDKDLKEIGIKLFGPRKKMTNAIARWHSEARPAMSDLEQAYADRLEAEMQEMAEQLQLAYVQMEELTAQVKQEQQLRSVTETCLMEERTAWNCVQRIIMDTRQQCEDFKDALRKLWQYIVETKTRVVTMEKTSQPIRATGAGAVGSNEAKRQDLSLADKNRKLANEKLPTESLLRKMDYYMQELQHLLGNVTVNTDRLLGRETLSQSPERGFT